MLTTHAAFEKFRGRLEITETEERSASRRHNQIRDAVVTGLPIGAVQDHFLTGAYRRETKTKPLRDVDTMIVFADASLADGPPGTPLETVRSILAPIYGPANVIVDDRAVRVDFGVASAGGTSDEVMSFDVVPAVADGETYLIPDEPTGAWIRTNPKTHAKLATDANTDLDGHWKPLVKMAKKWNDNAGRPIATSFIVEVMALELVRGPWGGSWPMEIRAFFGTAAARIGDRWPDPAGVGPDVADAGEPGASAAADALRAAEAACTEAMRLERAGQGGEALERWQRLFGPLFSKS